EPPAKEDLHEQTVGKVAASMIQYWTSAAGMDAKDFDKYWAVRKERRYCGSWFFTPLYRASGATSGVSPVRALLVQAVRKSVDAAPPAERDVLLLWVSTRATNHLDARLRSFFATDTELLDAAKRIGPNRLLKLIRGEPICDDPDVTALSRDIT